MKRLLNPEQFPAKSPRKTIAAEVVIGCVIFVVLLVFNAALTFHNSQLAHGISLRLSNTQEVVRLSNTLLLNLLDSETGQRGFLVTGDDDFLEPFEIARSNYRMLFEELKTKAAPDPVQSARLRQLEQKAVAHFELLEEGIEQRKKGENLSSALDTSKAAKAQMDNIRTTISEVVGDEIKMLQIRRDELDGSYEFALMTELGTTVIGLFVVCFFLWLMLKSIRRQAETDTYLGEQREWFRTTLSSIGDAVIATDVNGKVSFLNAIAQRLTGWDYKDASGKDLSEVFRIINESTRAAVENPVEKVLREGVTVGLANHTILVSKDGRETPIDDSAAPIRSYGGELTGVVLVFRDVSLRQQNERELQEADRRKDDFLAVLAHELRNPLAPLRNALEVMRLKPSLNQEANELRLIMERQVLHMVRLVDDLLDVSRIRNGKIVLQTAPTDLRTVIKTAVDSSQPQIDQLGHVIQVKVTDGPLIVDADATRLSQVISNLLTNAAKYTPPGGKIELSASSDEEYSVIRVKDNGVGIPSAMLQKIFEMFTQVDESISRSQGGLGIGLMLVKHLVAMHHGTVTAKSEGEGKGSEFTVKVPLSKSLALDKSSPSSSAGSVVSQRPDQAAIPSSPPAKRKILVVDDTRAAAMMLQKLLETLGNEVMTTHSVENALEILKDGVPEVIFSDIAMPGMDGYEFARKVRDLYPMAAPMMVAVTGYGQQNDKQLARQAGFDHHAVKPISITNLQKLMESYAPHSE